MSIPSADHTIYSFITLCLKEQGDIAGKMEITTKQGGGGGGVIEEVEHYHRQRRICVTGLRLGSGDRGRMTKKDVPLHSYTPPPTLNAHLCIIPSLTNCSARQNLICDRFAGVRQPSRPPGGHGEDWRRGRAGVKGSRL